MSHNSALVTHSRIAARETATEYPDVSQDFSAMATGIKKPAKVAGKLYDAARGRLRHPLGSYPTIAAEIADNGGSFFHIARPLTVMLAHLRRRCSNKLPQDMKAALVVVQREESEADVSELNLALSVQCPDTSCLLSYVKETREEILAKEHAVELAEDLLAAREQK